MDRLQTLQEEIAELRKALYDKENELYELKQRWMSLQPAQLQQDFVENQQYQCTPTENFPQLMIDAKLSRSNIERYSRQILLPDIGVNGQEKLSRARVLVIGAGGLGCPAAAYLAGAGVGEIGIVDYDTVDVSNLHRQILHGESDQYMSKVASATNALIRLNSEVTITPYELKLDSNNALEILSRYDLVLDCTDNMPTRYLINDVCVLHKIPLISGSALKMEGQLTFYGYRSDRNLQDKSLALQGPCYRCLFPVPPPAETVGTCSANGVAGPVPGVIGTLQALEAIKYIVGHGHKSLLVGRMLLFDGEDMTFRTVRLRMKNSECAACSETPTVIPKMDYESFCKAKAKEKDIDLKILTPDNRICAVDLAEKLNSMKINDEKSHLLVDVRSEPEFKMCRIDGAVNYPIDSLRNDEHFQKLLDEVKESKSDVTFVCRRGNDSQLAAYKVIEALNSEDKPRVKDLTGGLHAWSKDVDSNFPVY